MEKKKKKLSLKDRIEIPKYTLGEELANAISHGSGTILSVAALVLCVVYSAISHNTYAIVSTAIYGSSLILLYTMSTLYHSLRINNAKRVFRIIDHCSIFLLIAGTYTPYTLVAMPKALGWTIFGIIWGAAVLGIVLNSIDLKKYKKISMVLYLLMGWAIVAAFKPLTQSMEPAGIWLLVLGGVAYTVGALFYGIGKNKKYMHSVFHVFVLIGSILHFFSIFFYVI